MRKVAVGGGKRTSIQGAERYATYPAASGDSGLPRLWTARQRFWFKDPCDRTTPAQRFEQNSPQETRPNAPVPAVRPLRGQSWGCAAAPPPPPAISFPASPARRRGAGRERQDGRARVRSRRRPRSPQPRCRFPRGLRAAREPEPGRGGCPSVPEIMRISGPHVGPL